MIETVHKSVTKQIRNFVPYNAKLVQSIFPAFSQTAEACKIKLVVGLPQPYDAVVMTIGSEETIVFDLVNLSPYFAQGKFVCDGLLTHELIHTCIHYDYPGGLETSSYIEALDYITFDEGFAHALSFQENIFEFVFTDLYYQKFRQATHMLNDAILENDENKRAEYLSACNKNERYWDKFACVSGMLYLMSNLNDMQNIYKDGWRNFARKALTSGALK